ncbi:MAG: ATP-binding protein, partial [Anaerolineae bacterium]
MMHHKLTPTDWGPMNGSTWLDPLRDRAMGLAVGVLYVLGLVLAGSAQIFSQPGQHVWFALSTFFLSGLVLLLRQWEARMAAWVLVIGSTAIVLGAVIWGGLPEAIWLLFIPVGIASLSIGIASGVAAAVVCTLLLAFAPTPGLQSSPTIKGAALIGMWTTVGLIWVAVRSLMSPLYWAWSSYEDNRLDLEQVRSDRIQLYQTAEELATANQQLNRLNRLAQALRQTAEDERTAKERFVANVSHELRTPLNMIIGFCEMITNAPEAYGEGIPPSLLADLNVVLRNSQHLSSLIDDVLDLSQIEVGQMALTKERSSLEEIVESAAIAVRPLLETKGLYLRIDMPELLPQVLCDRTRIREVILNLLSNAGRFTERGGIEVHAHQDGTHVVISVTDTGPGIAEEDKARLFRPFEQLDGSIRRRYGGTGLGLSISKSFVELHEGEMWVESELGHGTTFFISLPIDPPPPLESTALRWFNPYERYEERRRRPRVQTTDIQPRLVLVEKGDAMQRILG